ncbi:DUF4037 domain-containing protein [Demequina globuliformis]|uniref:DUF4037 domain-containing protein n=1 Tax=Demequina globuliformis TaxID=676202 RepID=UPI000783A1C1|nr:DUF4037 domain-containing protein [Demequina globuliformis]
MTTSPHAQFPMQGFLERLDQAFAHSSGPDMARRILEEGVARAEQMGDRAALLTLRNEQAGFFRSVGAHAEALEAADAAVALVSELGLEGTDAETTTLINVATAQRAAGQVADATETYTRALDGARRLLGADDRRLAALHNNLSLALADGGDHAGAREHQTAALDVLRRAATDPDVDVDIAMTHSNLAHTFAALGDADGSARHASEAVQMFHAAGATDDPHLAAALAAQAATMIAGGDAAGAVERYEQALAIVDAAYGRDSDAYTVTAENLSAARSLRDARAQAPAGDEPSSRRESPSAAPEADRPAPASAPTHSPHVPGLVLARRYWLAHGKPLLDAEFPEYAGRIAAGLVGHGSECYGFDDAVSADHDFGVGFCWWLTAGDHAKIGRSLQDAYDSLPRTFEGYPVRPALAAHGQRRCGVFEIGEFFASLTGMEAAPSASEPHLWMALDEPTLAAATNGEVFADPHGAFGAARGAFLRMPRDVWLTHVSRRIAMMSQAGQYNVPRMLGRGDGEAAWLAVGEFVRAAASVTYLLNKPAQVGYLPYYKWQFAALRRLRERPLARLAAVPGDLTAVMRTASAACLGGAAFGEGGKGVTRAVQQLTAQVEAVCASVADELRTQGLSDVEDPFLEHHRPALAAKVVDPWLRGQ